MDNDTEAGALIDALSSVGVRPDSGLVTALLRFREELLRWNQKVNLTAITQPRDVLEKHFVDSLAVWPELGEARTVLDVGAGAGFPGIPLKLLRPDLEVTLVDTVGKKVAFMKNALVRLNLVPGARALHARAEGKPDDERIPRADLVISRAFMDVGHWVALGASYRSPGGRVVSMMGQAPSDSELDAAAEKAGLVVKSVRAYRLPWSGAERTVAVFAD